MAYNYLNRDVNLTNRVFTEVMQRSFQLSTFLLTDDIFFFISGSSEYDHVRPLSYSDVTVFVVCFDISNSSTLDNVQRKVHRHIVTLIALKAMFSYHIFLQITKQTCA